MGIVPILSEGSVVYNVCVFVLGQNVVYNDDVYNDGNTGHTIVAWIPRFLFYVAHFVLYRRVNNAKSVNERIYL